MDLENIEAIMDWLMPIKIHQVSRFMGLDMYYRRFMKGFSKNVNPIMEFPKKDKKLYG